MAQKIRKERITKVEWYARGGFANSALFRQQSRGGAWRYYVDIEQAGLNKAAQTLSDDIDARVLDDAAEFLKAEMTATGQAMTEKAARNVRH